MRRWSAGGAGVRLRSASGAAAGGAGEEDEHRGGEAGGGVADEGNLVAAEGVDGQAGGEWAEGVGGERDGAAEAADRAQRRAAIIVGPDHGFQRAVAADDHAVEQGEEDRRAGRVGAEQDDRGDVADHVDYGEAVTGGDPLDDKAPAGDAE